MLRNFIFEALVLSANHGTVSALIAIASAEFGPDLGGISLGLLFIGYATCALFLSSWIVLRLGSKWSIASSLFLNTVYVASFLVALEFPKFAWHSAIVGSLIGGLGTGVLWTAQGVFFAETATQYAEDNQIQQEESTTFLSGVFASIFVGLEVVLKFLSSFVMHEYGRTVTFAAFTVLAVISSILSAFVKDPPRLSIAGKGRGGLEKVMMALRFLRRERRMQLLAPWNIAFGLLIIFINLWVTGELIRTSLGENNVGYMAAVGPAVATLESIIFSSLAKRVGKAPIMVIGSLAFATLGAILGAVSFSVLVSLRWWLVFVFILSGTGRAVFEATNKATVADFFPKDTEAAFANVVILSGGASAVAAFVYPHLKVFEMTLLFGAVSMVSAFTTPLAFKLHKEMQLQSGYQLIPEMPG